MLYVLSMLLTTQTPLIEYQHIGYLISGNWVSMQVSYVHSPSTFPNSESLGARNTSWK